MSTRRKKAYPEALRIAVAGGIVGLPEKGDRSLCSLWSDLRNAKTWFVVGQRLRGQPQLNKKLVKVAKLADRLTALLSDEEVFCFLQEHLPFAAQFRSWHIHALTSAIAVAASEGQISPKDRPGPILEALGLGRWSAIVNMVRSLVRIYEKYAREKVRFQRGYSGKGPVGGKFLAFAEQALKELEITLDGKPFARETIVRAYTDAKRGAPRTHRR